MAAAEAEANAPPVEETPPGNRPKRVRTGCLTCRERHLKCDEGLPSCQNCRKSSRICRRGLRLNFIDIQVQAPPVVTTGAEWTVRFQDDSRDIASEYKGGLERYSILRSCSDTPFKNEIPFDFPPDVATVNTVTTHQQLPPIQSSLPIGFPDSSHIDLTPAGTRPPHVHHTDGEPTYMAHNFPQHTHPTQAYQTTDQMLTPPTESRDYLNSPDEVLFMQVFVEEVGLWMDSMDPMKHFSRLLPFHALGEPMLLNAFLACGVRHLTLVNPAYHEDKALHYYDTATRALLKSLQNPNRDTVICATTAVILNVYEIMSERALQRMNHIAGARALIKECGWNARSTGIGAACFWLNVGMELLSCLHFNWQVAWEPDDWGVDMDLSRETESGREEIWTYKIVYLVAKIANFRATIPRFQESSAREEQLRLHNRYAEWKRLKELCDAWNENIPRTMHPLAYLHPYQTTSKSSFPEVWLIKRTSIVARLFYHTAMCLLAHTNPAMPSGTDEMREMQLLHSHQICGIVAHVKDRGVASVALRSLAIAAECLVARREQEEILQIFDKIRKETGWRVGFLNKELKDKWGWQDEEEVCQPTPTRPQAPPQNPIPQAIMQSSASLQSFPFHTPASAQQPPVAPTPPATQRIPSGIMNPLMATADFSSQHHPYQSYYVAPNQQTHQNHFTF
ncbi:hypothetical protein L228DRAFT_267168 [Xylona heveae TC161]|uniref:Zn(2)-C6 fungal-type domain-containing protein n=1 Tax=Xylona heveae (strain CBS 132557 / TC161) TaxID=1328760 RepID=A0A165H8Y1_XYLHT|nr:hypothetical protein L228DRAFT_267168 [Xylona heveae TC161]KZF23151.1 hypothetical protein L228DRAFT_267168 [Xylona heveae TC161]